MAKYILKDAVLYVNGVNLSDRVAQVAVIMEGDDVDVSTMGTNVHQHLTGLRNDRFEVTFLNDEASGKVNQTLYPLLATADTQVEFTVYCMAFATGASTTNPKWQSTKCILQNLSPISGNIGDRSENQVVFPSNEAITRVYT